MTEVPATRFRVCAVVPTYENPRTVGAVVEAIAPHVETVIVVDDGSGPAGRQACEALAARADTVVVHRPENGGKGAAVKTGLGEAAKLGFTHALQVDADGQHALERAPAFVAAARAEPDALILGHPVYDETVPAVRLRARAITRFWVDLEAGRGVITDAMVGFRVYPVEASLAIGARGDRMDFDVEIAVRMARADVPIVNLPVGVRYLTAEEGGVSHFRAFGDNVRLSWLHARICTVASIRWVLRALRIIR